MDGTLSMGTECPMRILNKAQAQHRRILIIVKMTHSVDSVRSLALVTIFDQWDHEQSRHGGRDGEYVWAQQREFLLTMADLAILTAEYPTNSKQSPTLSPWNSTISTNQLASDGELITLDHFCHGRGTLCSYSIETYSSYGFAFLASMLLPK